MPKRGTIVILIIGVVVASYGLFATFSSTLRLKRGDMPAVPHTVEKVATHLSGGSVLLLIAVVAVSIAFSRRTSPGFLAAFVPVAAAVASPIFLWGTRWRGVAESIATLVLGVVIIITGFSIGMFLIPTALLMAVAVTYNRRAGRG